MALNYFKKMSNQIEENVFVFPSSFSEFKKSYPKLAAGKILFQVYKTYLLGKSLEELVEEELPEDVDAVVQAMLMEHGYEESEEEGEGLILHEEKEVAEANEESEAGSAPTIANLMEFFSGSKEELLLESVILPLLESGEFKLMSGMFHDSRVNDIIKEILEKFHEENS